MKPAMIVTGLLQILATLNVHSVWVAHSSRCGQWQTVGLSPDMVHNG